jgi:hypothetical protein
LVGCPSNHATDRSSHKPAEEEVSHGLYRTLREGGSLYAGSVASVIVQGHDTSPPFTEWGEIRFRVDRTLAGPPQEEMTVPFLWWDDRVKGVGSDWAGKSKWPGRPKVGEQLLLLIGDLEHASRFKDEFPLKYRWEVGPDDPFVEGFALAAQYLVAKDEATQEDLYRRLCESPFQNMRTFALQAAFSYLGKDKVGEGYTLFGGDYDPVRQSNLALLYFKHAAPRLSVEERPFVTITFAGWFMHRRALAGVRDELKDEFEDWYVKELSARDNMRRPEKALEGLGAIQKENGIAATIALFKKTGRDGLMERLEDCARSGDPAVEGLSKELLTKLDAP